MRFSIIVPVYNVEKYIDKCMASIMGQSYDDFEVIVVNDETPDNSMAIVERYAQEYPGKIRMIHQKNTRQGGARNRGVREASGEYLLFVDSDDYVHRDLLKTVDQHLRKTPCDILVFRNVPVTEDGKILHVDRHGVLPNGVYDPRKDKEVLMIPVGPVNKAFRRSFYVDARIEFPEKLLYEDAIMRIAHARAASVAVCDDVLYYYVQSGNSSMRRKPSEKMLDILTVSDLVLERFREDGLYQSFEDILDISLIYGILIVVDLINEAEPGNALQVPLADYIQEHFPNYAANPYMTPELCRTLDCLTAHAFYKYHLRFLLVPRIKERLVSIPLVAALNAWRKKL